MQLPAEDSAYIRFVTFSSYVSARCRRARQAAWAEEVLAVGRKVLEAGRAKDDAELAVQIALADRDGCDDELDELAGSGRLALASRTRNAMKEEPYTQVFPHGIEHVTEAPLEEQVSRYQDLARRYETFLPAGDPVRADGPRLHEALGRWTVARDGVNTARSNLGVAGTALATAHDAWATTMGRVYGRLFSAYGKKRAERFFPKRKRGEPSATPTDETPA